MAELKKMGVQKQEAFTVKQFETLMGRLNYLRKAPIQNK